MKNTQKAIKLALLGTALIATAALTSCCGSSPDPISSVPVMTGSAK